MEGRWVAVTAVAPIAWGATYWVTGRVLPVGEPLWGGVLRALPAGLLLLALPHRGGRRLRGAWWWRAAVLGCLVNASFFALVHASAQLLPTGVAATATGASPLVLLLLSWALLGLRPGWRAFGAGGAGLVGVLLVVSGSSGGVGATEVSLALLGVLVFAAGTVLSQRWSSAAAVRGEAVPPPLTMVTWQLVLSGMLLAPVAAAAEGAPVVLGGRGLVALAFVSLVATALAFTCWFVGLAHLGAGAVGLVGLLNPVTGVVLGAVLGGERFAAPQVLGVALVLGGIALGQGPRDRHRGLPVAAGVAVRVAVHGAVHGADRGADGGADRGARVARGRDPSGPLVP